MNYLAVLIVGIAILTMLGTYQIQKAESFYLSDCPDCSRNGWRDRDFCSACRNCGWSIDYSNHGTCIPGYYNGPVKSLNTRDWFYQNRHIWRKTGPRHPSPKPIKISYQPVSDRLRAIPFWQLTHFHRMRNDYGPKRYGIRYGYGLNKRYGHKQV